MLEKYTKVWDKIKYHIQAKSAGRFGQYDKESMKIKFSSDDDLPLNKILKLHMLTISHNPNKKIQKASIYSRTKYKSF